MQKYYIFSLGQNVIVIVPGANLLLSSEDNQSNKRINKYNTMQQMQFIFLQESHRWTFPTLILVLPMNPKEALY